MFTKMLPQSHYWQRVKGRTEPPFKTEGEAPRQQQRSHFARFAPSVWGDFCFAWVGIARSKVKSSLLWERFAIQDRILVCFDGFQERFVFGRVWICEIDGGKICSFAVDFLFYICIILIIINFDWFLVEGCSVSCCFDHSMNIMLVFVFGILWIDFLLGNSGNVESSWSSVCS